MLNFWHHAGSGHISTRPVPATCHSRELTSPIVMDAWSLCCLLPVRPLVSMLVRRAACRGGVGHDDPLTMLGHGIVSGQVPGMGPSLSPPTMSVVPA